MKLGKSRLGYSTGMAIVSRSREVRRAAILEYHKQHDRKPPSDATIRAWSTGFDKGWDECLAVLKMMEVI